MKTSISKLVVLMTLTIIYAATFAAIPVFENEAEVDRIGVDSVVKTTTEIPLREGPPKQGLIYMREKRIGTVQKEEFLKVKSMSVFKNLLGNQKWIEVERDQSKLREGERSRGWIYAGDEGKKSCCLELNQNTNNR